MAEDDSRHFPATAWILRACLAIRCFALGDAFLWNTWERDSDLFGMMLFDWRWSESLAMRIEDGLISAMVVVGVFVLVAGWFQRTSTASRLALMWRRVEQAALWFVLAFEISFALALTIRGGKYGSDFTFASHALRIAMPITLLMWSARRPWPTAQRFTNGLLAVLRTSIAITFIAHGWKAWQSAPEYTTLVLGGWLNTLGGSMDQPTAEVILKWIGAIDILCGAAILFIRSRVAIFYLIVWGLFSAIGRTVGGGLMYYPETFLRLAHAGGPLALYLEWKAAGRFLGPVRKLEKSDGALSHDGQR